MNDLQKAMENLRADEGLKQRTLDSIQKQALHRRSSHSHRSRFVAALCSFVLLLVAATGIGGYTLYAKPVSYISLDINPSIELALNYWNRVVSVTPLNEDGNALIQDLSLQNLYYTEAVDLLLEKAEIYSSNDLNVTVTSDHADELISGIESCHNYGLYRGHCSEADPTEHQEAHELGISVAKYRLYLQLIQYDPSLTVEDCAQMNMHQLRALLQKYTSGDSSTEDSLIQENSQSNGRGSGHSNGHGNGNRHGNHS